MSHYATLWIENFFEIALSCIVSEINTFLYFTQIFNMAAENGGNDFWQKVADNYAYALWVKNFIEIALSCTISIINTFLRVYFQDGCQNFGKQIFGKKVQMTLSKLCGSKISSQSLYLALFPR